MKLDGKRVMVTGGCGDLGRPLVAALSAAGAAVTVLDRDQAGLAELKKQFHGLAAYEVDLTNAQHVEAVVEQHLAEHRVVDILINNAGLIFSAPLVRFKEGKLERHTAEDWDRVLKANLSSAFYVTATVVEKMLSQRTKGLVINICSISAEGNPGQSAYAAAKAGLAALTKTWAKELGPLGLRFAAIAPGFIDTPSTRNALPAGALDEIKKRVPLRRLGTPSEFVTGICSIIENDYFHGQILSLDGGLTV